MKTKGKIWWQYLSLWLLVPVILVVVPGIFGNLLPNRFGQAVCDAVIILVALGLNRWWWHLTVTWWQGVRFGWQLLQVIPAVIFVFLTHNYLAMSLAHVTALTVVTLLLIASAEELVFRGLLIPLSLRLTHQRVYLALILSSLGFAFAHLVNVLHASPAMVLPQIILVFATGMLLGAVYVKTHNLCLTIALHALDDLPVLAAASSSGATTSGTQLLILDGVVLALAVVASVVAWLQVRHMTVPTVINN
ncbi:CPBP family intramembrane glutamic endopeptidase [Lactiplantibacillus fabifermentans]|nr:CPBP family intramembrane glutamic endopeptidase [Lactiplantibacillus fabifermentans]